MGTRDLAQVAWNFINDSLRTTVCLQYSPRYVAAAALSLAVDLLRDNKRVKVELPTLYSSFSVTEQGVLEVTSLMRKVYPEKEYGGNGSAEPARLGTNSGTPNGGAKAAGVAEARAEGNADMVTKCDADVVGDGTEEASAGNSGGSTRSVQALAGEGVRREAPNGSTETAGALKRSSSDVTLMRPDGPDPPLKRAKEDVEL
mmetsp:Transcript_24234/g.75856  ORF Transcript_24234/g.75856 Transcript_24234/m.75856 type:complete len:201 (+) Transcript_24234:756-1358(+)